MADFLLGLNAKAYFHTTAGISEPSSMTELSNIKDVILNFDKAEVDTSTRANSGWRTKASSLKDCSIDIEMQCKTGDAGLTAIKNSWLNNTVVAMAFLTAAYDEEGAEGPIGDFSVTKFTRSEPLEGVITYSATLVISTFTEWYEG